MRLQGNRLTLTSKTIEDAQTLLPAFNGDTQFNEWRNRPQGLVLNDACADIEDMLSQTGGSVWGIFDQNSTLIGIAETAYFSFPETAWIDLLIIRDAFQGQGYGSEAASLLELYLFSSSEVRQIKLSILVQNAPALAFWEKRGYERGERYLDSDGDDVYAYLLHRSRADL